jgi:hypothetical protein
MKTAKLTNVKDAGNKIEEAFSRFRNDEITLDELNDIVNECVPQPPEVGVDVNDEGPSVVNTKPIPKNWQSAVFFYIDEDGKMEMTVRIAGLGDNAEYPEEEEGAERLDRYAERAAFDVLRLIHNEHHEIIQNMVIAAAFEHAGRESGDDLLGDLDDEVKDQVTRHLH